MPEGGRLSTTFHPSPDVVPGDEVVTTSKGTSSRVLLLCGVLYGVIYAVAADVIAATVYDGYSRIDQAISELSGTSAPTRWFLTAMLPIYTVLMVAFGIGVRRSARGRRPLRVAGDLLIAWAVTGLAWLAFPMSSREDIVEGPMTSNDLGHLVLSGLTGVLVLSTLWFGVATFGRRFRRYTLATAAAVVVFGGVLTSMEGSKVPDPTPWMGLYERIGLYGFYLWLAVLAVVLLREGRAADRGTLTPHAP